MKLHIIIHRIALIALVILAVMNIVRVPSSGNGVRLDHTTLVPFLIITLVISVALWSFLIWKIWSKPRTWGLGVGLFLWLMLAFQTYLWSLAIASPRRVEGMIYSTQSFVLYELPLVVAAVSCLILRWCYPPGKGKT